MGVETKISKSIRDWLEFKGYRVIRVKAEPTYDPKKGVYRKHTSNDGVSDIIAIHPNGQIAALEVKKPDEYRYVLRHYWKLLKRDFEPWNKRKERLFNQIEFTRFVNNGSKMGGFACSLETAQLVIDGKFMEQVEGEK